MAEHYAADPGLADISDPANCLVTGRMVRSKEHVIIFLKAQVLISLIMYLEIIYTLRNRMRGVRNVHIHIYIVFIRAAPVIIGSF